MKTSLNKLVLLLIFSVMAFAVFAEVDEYNFIGAVGTYTEITGGTILGTNANDNENFNAIDLGFTFTYNDVEYTQVSVQTNGFLAMGPEVVTSNLAISAATGTNNIVAAMNRDLKSRDNGELMYLLSGTAPNRVFTVQWKNYRRSPTSCANDILSFQIQLHEDGNKVVFAYGGNTAMTVSTAQSVQVGLRGDSNLDFNNRSTTEDWTATTAGTANNASCRINADIYPPEGLTFTFAPPAQGTPPSPAVNPIPALNATNIAINTNLSWSTGGGTVDGYKLYFGTNTPPTNLVNGTVMTETVYDPASDLNYSTVYYWRVVPFNADGGDAENCPIWQFTTLADPTVNTFPYVQNFDDVTAPALPLGWSAINANNDAYAWETYAGSADTAPNAARIRYSTTQAMNDWLLTPPLNLDAENTYLIRFSYRANSESFPEALSVYTGTAPTAAALTNQIFTNTNITNTAYQQAQIFFTPATSGTHYIGFHGHSPANMFYLYVDSFSIMESTDSMDPPTQLTATAVNNSYVALDWLAPGDTPPPPPPTEIDEGFESYPDFALTFDPWVLVDVDGSGTYGVQGYSWPNVYSAMAYMIFNPSATTPPLASLEAHSGSKMAASFASTQNANNDWMISPAFTPAAGQFLNFYARSYVSDYGLERFKVGVSNGGTAPANFTIISGANYIQAPINWTLYSYDLSSYAGQEIRFGIQCLSDDAFFFLVDDITVGTPPSAKTVIASTVPTEVGRSTGTPVPAPRTATRELEGYNVYRDGALLSFVPGAGVTSYEDHSVTVGTYSYTVTAVYTSGESTPAGPASATIHPPNQPPVNLTADVEGSDVTLNWESPEAPQQGEWITWCNETTLGNAIGTNGVVTFDVAHRFTQSDLTAHQGKLITQVQFAPHHAACVYTIKVWTGGSASNAGTLVSSQVVESPVMDEWNLAVLNTPVPVPSTGDLYVGYECNTQGGYPAGCDAGPQIEGKGNMMYIDGSWATLTQLAPSLTYNWMIKTFVAETNGMKAVELSPIAEHETISYSKAPLAFSAKTAEQAEAKTDERLVAGFKVYRDGTLIATLNDPSAAQYTDYGVPNGTYIYGVTAVHTTGESEPAQIEVTVDLQLAEIVFEDDFESYDNFTLQFAPWTLLDVDLSETYSIQNVDFPNAGAPMAYMIFNPSATVPAVTGIQAHSGSKMAASFAAVNGPNNDWLITPRIQMGTDSSVRFYARSHTAQYGMERFRVGVSMLPNVIPQGFQYVSPGNYVEAPAGWMEYIYDLSAYDGQTVRIGIRCVSDDAFIFYVDDFSVHSDGGTVDIDDPGMPALVTELQGNYPNPFNPSTTIRYSVKEATPVTIGIYNVKGQLVKTLVNEDKSSGNHSVVWNGRDNNNQAVSSGVYFYKMLAGKYSSTKKMILMK